MNSRLVIVTGASGAVGQCFVDHFLPEDRTTCVAVSRSPMETEAVHCQVDLTDDVAVKQAITQLDLDGIANSLLAFLYLCKR
ncbi:MAG: NAD-dependent epimerase/dehydratase family protein [Geitlerinemataceae cyanobacterium]